MMYVVRNSLLICLLAVSVSAQEEVIYTDTLPIVASWDTTCNCYQQYFVYGMSVETGIDTNIVQQFGFVEFDTVRWVAAIEFRDSVGVLTPGIIFIQEPQPCSSGDPYDISGDGIADIFDLAILIRRLWL